MSNFASKLSDIVKSFSSDTVHNYFNSAIIVAAGNGTRMGNDATKTKQMTCVDGIPIIVRTISQFEASRIINEIIIVAREDEVAIYNEFIKKYCFNKVVHVVVGSSTRQKSVLAGFKKISDKSDFVTIHDGARCLVTTKNIEDVEEQACIYGAATAATCSRDTVKKSDKSGFIDETIDRTYLWLAQTPQIFKTDLYRAAAFIALKNGFEVTDDCMLAENIGFKIKLVDCGHENIKITTKADLYIAEAIIKMRKDGVM